MDPRSLTAAIKDEAMRLGFDLAGACPAVPTPGIEGFRQWLAAGYAGQMHYLGDRAGAYEHPRHVLDGVRSLLVLAANYRPLQAQPAAAGEGLVSCYAWGTDYHRLIRDRLRAGPAASPTCARRPGPWRGRYRAAHGAIVCPLGRTGLDRQEYPPANQDLGELGVSGRAPVERRAGLRRAVYGQSLRHVPGVPGRLPHRHPGRRLSPRRTSASAT